MIDPSRLAPARGSRLAFVGACGGIGTSLVKAALAQGLQVVNLDMPISIAKRPALPGEWQIPCDASLSGGIAQAFAQVGERWGRSDLAGHIAGCLPGQEQNGTHHILYVNGGRLMF